MADNSADRRFPGVQFEHPAIDFLTEAINELRQGKITTVCCICIGPQGETKMPTAGMQISELNLAADLIKARVVAQVSRPSPIVRPT